MDSWQWVLFRECLIMHLALIERGESPLTYETWCKLLMPAIALAGSHSMYGEVNGYPSNDVTAVREAPASEDELGS